MKTFRRVVTGFNEEGKSCIKWDTLIEPKNVRPGFDNVPLWATKKLPAESSTLFAKKCTEKLIPCPINWSKPKCLNSL